MRYDFFFLLKKGPFVLTALDIREFTPESWRNIIGVVPQARDKAAA